MAVQVRKLSADEASKHFPRRGQMDLSEYADAMRDLQPGDGAEVRLGDLTPRALKRRVGQAARQRGYTVRWSDDAGGGALRFQVREAPRPGRRGRRRKSE